MTHPFPIGIFSIVAPLLVVGLLAVCARWLWRSFHPTVRSRRTLLLTAVFLLGLWLAYCFAFRHYQYNADWTMVGVPIPAVWFERTMRPDGTIFWKDWIGWPMPVGFLGNILFWVLLPALPLAVFVRLFQKPDKRPRPSNT